MLSSHLCLSMRSLLLAFSHLNEMGKSKFNGHSCHLVAARNDDNQVV